MNRHEIYAAVRVGLTEYQRQRFHEAHEAWEDVWREQSGEERQMLQGLIQLAAALKKNAGGNARGRMLNLEKARQNLRAAEEVRASILGFDLVELGAATQTAIDRSSEAPEQSIAAPELPRTVGPDGVLYLHGFASSPASAKARAIAPALRRDGLHVEVPDQNEGAFRELTISRAIRLAERKLRDRTLVIGSSLGGYVASLLALRDDRVQAMLLMAPAFDFAARLEQRYGRDAIDAWREVGQVMVEHYGYGDLRPIGIGLLDDAALHPPFPPIHVPTRILHGSHDETVPILGSVRTAEAHPDEVSLETLDDDHGLGASGAIALERARALVASLGLTPDPSPLSSED